MIRSFYEGRTARGWLVDYYDDEAWMTLALMRAYDLTGEQKYLDTAESTYQDIMTQWDTRQARCFDRRRPRKGRQIRDRVALHRG